MTVNYRVVDIIVPNRTPHSVKAALEIASVDPAKLEGVRSEAAALKVRAYGLTAEMCGDAKNIKTQRHLALAVAPFQEVNVRVIIETDDPSTGKAIAAFQMTDTRAGVLTGGVTIVCTSPRYPSDLPPMPGPSNPCPLILGAGLTAIDPGTDPRSPANPGIIDTRHPQDLVALVENPSRATLKNALMWLEHMDQSGVRWESRVWHLGAMEHKARFWATFAVDGRGSNPGQWEASFVVASDNFDPVRLRAGFRILPRNR
jgi:hypothetical protein